MLARLIPWVVFFSALRSRQFKPKQFQAWLTQWAFNDAGVAIADEHEVDDDKRLSLEERQKRTALLLIMNGRWLKKWH